jgi:DNA-directed RNA polymerase specialized sigma24 family protein
VADLEYALEVRMESFPHFDLTILTRKQLDVLVMRYRGGLSWRKIAAFEGVSDYAVRCRHAGASKKLRQQGPKSP